MIKLAGCITVIAGCSAAGIIKALSYKERCSELENILELIRVMEMEITYKKEPLHKTFEKIAALKECWFCNLLRTCSRKLADSEDLKNAWDSSITDNLSACPLHEEDLIILRDITLGLGKSDTGGQKSILEPAVIRLEKALKNAKMQYEKQGRMYRGLGISAGIIIVIMFI